MKKSNYKIYMLDGLTIVSAMSFHDAIILAQFNSIQNGKNIGIKSISDETGKTIIYCDKCHLYPADDIDFICPYCK